MSYKTTITCNRCGNSEKPPPDQGGLPERWGEIQIQRPGKRQRIRYHWCPDCVELARTQGFIPQIREVDAASEEGQPNE